MSELDWKPLANSRKHDPQRCNECNDWCDPSMPCRCCLTAEVEALRNSLGHCAAENATLRENDVLWRSRMKTAEAQVQRVRDMDPVYARDRGSAAEHLIEHLQERLTQVQNQKDALREDNSRLLRDNRRMSKAMSRAQALADSWLSWIHRSQEMGATSFTVGEAHFALTRALRGKKAS